MATNTKKPTYAQAVKIIDQFIRNSLKDSKEATGEINYAFVTGQLSVIAASLLAGEQCYALEDIEFTQE